MARKSKKTGANPSAAREPGSGKAKAAGPKASTASPSQPRPRGNERHYIKAADCRTVYAHGVWGGSTPRVELHMAFWTERPPIPQVVLEPTSYGERPERQGKGGLIREVSTVVLMDLPTAVATVKWMQGHIDNMIGQLEMQGVEIPSDWR